MSTNKQPRPDSVPSETRRYETQCGHLYVTITCQDGKPFEVFAHLGKSGTCATCQTEAITRAVTSGLRYGVPVDEYVRTLRGIQCPGALLSVDGNPTSCADAISKALAGWGASG